MNLDYEISASSSISELNASSDIQPQDKQVIKYKVPYCKELSPENIVAVLTPYEEIIKQLEAFLLWRFPLQSLIFLIYFNICSLLIYLFDLSFVNVLIIILVTIVILAMIHEHKSVVHSFFFPQIPEEKSKFQSNRIYTLTELSHPISTIGSRIYCFYHSCFQKATDMSFLGQFSWISILVCLFVFFKIVKTFWIIVISTNTILILPGIIFHPSVYPKIKDNLNWMMMVISPKLRND